MKTSQAIGVLLAVLVGATTGVSQSLSDAPQSVAALQASDLRCEMRREPLGIDTMKPRLSWKLESEERGQAQSAYRVLVAQSPAAIAAGSAELWDSGKIESDRSLHVEYAGQELESRQRCWWSVMVWDAEGRASGWSEPASWEMGLCRTEDWVAKWIDDGQGVPEKDEEHYREDPAPLMRREFEVEPEVQRARLYVSGLGYYEASLNGERVGDQVLDPIWTDYDTRVFYSTYDVTELVREGANALGLTLGNGWYNPLPLRMWGHLNLREHLPTGRPCAIAQLEIEYADGRRETIASDESWRQAPGPLLRNNIYLGEIHDARREMPGWDSPGFEASEWAAVSLASEPLGALQSQPLQPIRVTEHLQPVACSEPEPGTYVIDLGQNFAGWVRLSVEGAAGTRVRMRFGELLHEDGSLNPLTAACGQIKGPGRGGPGAPDVAVQENVYVLRGGGPESYTPRFTFQGFRYVELTGYPGVPPLDCLEGLRLSCDVEEVGSFACSNEQLNRIHEMVRWTFLSNLFGVQSDCPHRERFGYGGDIVSTAEAFILNLDMSSFYPKAVVDFADSTPASGAFPMTAPYVGIAYAGLDDGDSPIGWSIAHPLLVRELHRYYGDRRIVEEQYAAAKRWVEYLREHTEGYLVEKGLSDHESLVEKPVRVSSTSFYARGATLAAELAAILGKEADAARYSALAGEIREAFGRELVEPDSGAVGIGTQAAQAIALQGGLVPAGAREAAFRRIADPLDCEEASLSTGIFGTLSLLDVLCREGRADLAYDLVNRTEFPGWGFMLENGATTLWEHWQLSENTFSHNHPMFGSVSTWMFQWLAGIAPAPEAVGFDSVLMRPQLAEGLDRVKATYNSVRGSVESEWNEQRRFTWTVSLPPGVAGEVVLPVECDGLQARESGRAIGEAPGVEELAPGRYRIASGRYVFTAPLR